MFEGADSTTTPPAFARTEATDSCYSPSSTSSRLIVRIPSSGNRRIPEYQNYGPGRHAGASAAISCDLPDIRSEHRRIPIRQQADRLAEEDRSIGVLRSMGTCVGSPPVRSHSRRARPLSRSGAPALRSSLRRRARLCSSLSAGESFPGDRAGRLTVGA